MHSHVGFVLILFHMHIFILLFMDLFFLHRLHFALNGTVHDFIVFSYDDDDDEFWLCFWLNRPQQQRHAASLVLIKTLTQPLHTRPSSQKNWEWIIRLLTAV